MGPDSAAAGNDDPKALFQWSARKVPPIVLLYVAIVFAAFIAVSYLGFRSMTAVKALAMAAVASIVPLVPTVLQRFEYRLTAEKVERRPCGKGKPRDFETVFRLDELSHVVRIRHGFKFFMALNESNLIRRFWKLHVSDTHSGEVKIEKEDQEMVLQILNEHSVRIR